MRGEERSGGSEAAARFRSRLADLKRNGCNVLLVGTDALCAACERLLGESSAGPRYRLFVTTDARPSSARAKLSSVQSGPYSDQAAVVNWQADVRGGATADVRGETPADGSGSAGPPVEGGECVGTGGSGDVDQRVREVTIDSDDLRDLGTAVEETIAEFESEAGALSPAELRLCFDSITPLVADHGDRTVRRFLLGLTETVERFDGMAHYHLPAAYGSDVVESVEPLFDAVVEVRYGADEMEQRWHLSNPDLVTDWIPL